MDIYTYLAIIAITFILMLVGLMKSAGIMHIFAMLIGLAATAELFVDGSLVIPFGNCFSGQGGSTVCQTTSFAVAGDMPSLILALLTILNAAMLIQRLRS